jgi:hypothetical protein
VHFDGEEWVRSETQVEGRANAIAPVTESDVWAVGSPIQRFDGAAWTASADVPREGELFGVAVVSPTDVWAVGLRSAGDDATASLVMRFDGQAWAGVDPTEQGAAGSDALLDVDAMPDGTVFAVGYRDVEAGRRTLAVIGTTCLPE